jgi:hypothetical protein
MSRATGRERRQQARAQRERGSIREVVIGHDGEASTASRADIHSVGRSTGARRAVKRTAPRVLPTIRAGLRRRSDISQGNVTRAAATTGSERTPRCVSDRRGGQRTAAPPVHEQGLAERLGGCSRRRPPKQGSERTPRCVSDRRGGQRTDAPPGRSA